MSLLLIFQSDGAPVPPPDVGHRLVSARLLDKTGAVVPGSPLANGFDISFYDELNGPGRGQISLSLSEAGSSELVPGRYVDCLIDGTSRFTFKIEGNPEYKIIERGEEHDQIVTVSGRGWACVLDEAIIYPEYGRNFALETTWRIFSFASPSYPRAPTWNDSYPYAEYLEGVSTVYCYGHAQVAPDGLSYPAPIGFPWPTNSYNLVNGVKTDNYVDTFWLRPDPADMPNWNDPGFYFFRGQFTLTADLTPVLFTVTGDNFFTFFLEGVPILGEKINTGDHFMWQGWKQQPIFLPAGTYTVAAAVYNISWTQLGSPGPVTLYPCAAEGYDPPTPTDGNPGGLLAAIFVDGDALTPPVYILTTDETWTSAYDPITWPGWTPGEIVQQLLDEAAARGAITTYSSNTFFAAVDTDGDPWRPAMTGVDRPDIPTFPVSVGSTVMAALGQLHDTGYANWHVTPGVLTLDMWRGRLPVAPTASAVFTEGVNIMAYERNSTAPYANALMVQWEGGYIIVEDTAAITAYGTRVEDVYSSDAPSEEEATLQGQNELLLRAQSAYPAIVAVIEPTSAADCPYEAFGVHDYVEIPGGEIVRCLSINCVQDDEGWATWTMELNAKLDVPERRTTQLLQQIGGRNQVVRGAVNS